MMKRLMCARTFALVWLVVAALLVGACGPAVPDFPPTVDANYVQTVIAATVAAMPTNTPPPTETPLPTPTQTNTPEPTPTFEPTPTWTLVPAPPTAITPTATIQVGPVLTPTPLVTPFPAYDYRDDFETVSWYQGSTETLTFRFEEGSYYIKNNRSYGVASSSRAFNYANVRLEVDAQYVAGGPETSYYGLVCRYQDSINYYAFVIGPNNHYGIARVVNGVPYYLDAVTTPGTATPAAATPVPVNFTATATNRIVAMCVNQSLTLFVNETALLRAEDNTYASGYVGLMVGNMEEGGAEVRFDNFALLRP